MAIEKSANGWLSLANIEIDDTLMVSRHNGDLEKVKVTSVTKTRFKTSDGRSWMKDSHRLVGGDTWTRTHIIEYDETKWVKSRDKQEHRRLVESLSRQHLEKQTLQTLRDLWALSCGLQPSRDLDT